MTRTLKTFYQRPPGRSPEDPAMRAVKHNIIADRAERYRCAPPRPACSPSPPASTRRTTAWPCRSSAGARPAFWVIDYIELPATRPTTPCGRRWPNCSTAACSMNCGLTLDVQATCIDAGGHRTEAVKAFVRDRRIRRPLAIFGAVPNNAPVLSKGKMQDIDWKGRYDKRGVLIQHVGTVGIKHTLYARLSTDADKAPETASAASPTNCRRNTSPAWSAKATTPAKPLREEARRPQRTARHLRLCLRRHAPPDCRAAPRHQSRLGSAGSAAPKTEKRGGTSAQPENGSHHRCARCRRSRPAPADSQRMEEAMTDPENDISSGFWQPCAMPAPALRKRCASPPSSRCASSSAASGTTSPRAPSGKGARPRLGHPVGGEHQGSDA